jgi:hypothetical protein
MRLVPLNVFKAVVESRKLGRRELIAFFSQVFREHEYRRNSPPALAARGV